jgi:hypothetical protein
VRVLVTGSRDWSRDETVRAAISEVHYFDAKNEAITLVSGHCPTGADVMAERWARRFGWTVEEHPAHWRVYGKRAGFQRNAEMVGLGADVCLAFQRDGSKGTQHTIDLCRAAGIPVRYWSETSLKTERGTTEKWSTE